jgi:hypothetical protein
VSRRHRAWKWLVLRGLRVAPYPEGGCHRCREGVAEDGKELSRGDVRGWKNGRGVLSLSESLSLFFPQPHRPPLPHTNKKRLLTLATPHDTCPIPGHARTRPAHKLDTVRCMVWKDQRMRQLSGWHETS